MGVQTVDQELIYFQYIKPFFSSPPHVLHTPADVLWTFIDSAGGGGSDYVIATQLVDDNCDVVNPSLGLRCAHKSSPNDSSVLQMMCIAVLGVPIFKKHSKNAF
jgi:hypothetical protein